MNAKLTIICILLIPAALFSQNAVDSNSYRPSISTAVLLFHQVSPDQAPIYSAPQYIRFPFPIKEGQAFFKEDKLEPGTVFYDDVQYDNVQLMHDEIRDQLIISDYRHTTLLLLYTKKVEWFNIYSQKFVRLDKDSLEGLKNDLGFCQLIFSGHARVYKKEVKSITTKAENSDNLSRYIGLSIHYYINYKQQFAEINSSKDLLAVFGDSKKELSQYLRANKLKFRKNKENVIVKAAAFIEQTKK